MRGSAPPSWRLQRPGALRLKLRASSRAHGAVGDCSAQRLQPPWSSGFGLDKPLRRNWQCVMTEPWGPKATSCVPIQFVQSAKPSLDMALLLVSWRAMQACTTSSGCLAQHGKIALEQHRAVTTPVVGMRPTPISIA